MLSIAWNKSIHTPHPTTPGYGEASRTGHDITDYNTGIERKGLQLGAHLYLKHTGLQLRAHLEHKQASLDQEAWPKVGCHPASGIKDGRRYKEGHPCEPAPHAMGVLHVEYPLKLLQSKVSVDTAGEGCSKARRAARHKLLSPSSLLTGRSRTHYLYSGNCLYFSKASSHSDWLRGGFMPLIRCHSTIERPLSVSLVTPPVK